MLQAPEILLSENRPSALPVRGAFQTFSGARLEALSKEWRLMIREGEYAEPFYQPEWIRAYAHAFHDSEELSAITVYRGGSLLSILPLAHRPTFFGLLPAHALCGISGLHSCRTDLIHAPNEGEVAARETWKVLRDHLTWTAIELLDVPRTGAFHRVLDLARQDGFLVGRWDTRRMPYLPISSDVNKPFSNSPTTHKVFRSRLDKKLRKLKQSGEVALNRITEGDRSHVERFFQIESAGWKGRRGSAIACSKKTLDFYQAVTQAGSMRHYLRLYSLDVNNTTIAMYLGFAMNGTVFMPKIAYDESFAVYSPGQLLTKLVIEDLTREGASSLEFLGPRAPWKNTWTDSCINHSNCYIFRPSSKGRLLHLITMRGAASLRPLKKKIFGDPQA